ncbi:MAG: VOC family protein [Parvularculaceae bacterium]|jgi:hypothetical protein
MRKLKFGQRTGEIMQIAYVVDDLEAAAHRWMKRFNFGPWVILDHFRADNMTYLGKPTDLDVSIALAYSGGMCFELIQKHNDVPSVYDDAASSNGLGSFHHWAVATETFDDDVARFARDDRHVVFFGEVVAVGGLRFAYVDTRTDLNGMIELIEIGPPVEELFAGVRDRADTWDRKTPFVRPG